MKSLHVCWLHGYLWKWGYTVYPSLFFLNREHDYPMDLGAHDFKTKPYVTVSLSMILWCFRGTLADDNTRSARSVSETFFSPPDPQPVQLHATTTCQGESLDISSVKIAYFGGWNYRLYKSPKGDVQHREISVPM